MTNGQNPTAILRDEHENVLRKLDSLGDAISRMGEDEAPSDSLKELASFFSIELPIHLTKEEQALFPEIERFIPRNAGPTGVMWVEHDDLRTTLETLRPLIDRYFEDPRNPEVKGDIHRHSAHFIGLLREHIDKENNILFMMADMHLDRGQKDTVIKLFHEIETGGKG